MTRWYSFCIHRITQPIAGQCICLPLQNAGSRSTMRRESIRTWDSWFAKGEDWSGCCTSDVASLIAYFIFWFSYPHVCVVATLIFGECELNWWHWWLDMIDRSCYVPYLFDLVWLEILASWMMSFQFWPQNHHDPDVYSFIDGELEEPQIGRGSAILVFVLTCFHEKQTPPKKVHFTTFTKYCVYSPATVSTDKNHEDLDLEIIISQITHHCISTLLAFGSADLIEKVMERYGATIFSEVLYCNIYIYILLCYINVSTLFHVLSVLFAMFAIIYNTYTLTVSTHYINNILYAIWIKLW